MALGRIDYYVLKPWRSPDELFPRPVAAKKGDTFDADYGRLGRFEFRFA